MIEDTSKNTTWTITIPESGYVYSALLSGNDVWPAATLNGKGLTYLTSGSKGHGRYRSCQTAVKAGDKFAISVRGGGTTFALLSYVLYV